MYKSLLFCIDVNRIISPLVYDCKVKTECDIVNFFESFLISLWIYEFLRTDGPMNGAITNKTIKLGTVERIQVFALRGVVTR